MNWTLDQQHIDLGFAVKHMMVATVRGRFTQVEADIDLDEQAPENSSVRAVVRVASLTTGNDERDAHLKSADFLDVARFPELTFRSTSVRRIGDSRFELTGDLTIHDVTKPVVLKGEFTGPVKSPWGDRRAGFSLTGELDREAFGLTWNVAIETGGVVVGKIVKLNIEAELIERADVEVGTAEAAGG